MLKKVIKTYDLDISEYSRKEVLEYIYNIKKNDDGRFISNIGGWQCEAKPNKLIGEVVIGKVLACTEDYLREIAKDFEEEEISKVPKIDGVWYNINPPGTFNVAHSHHAVGLSAVAYFQGTDGDIAFISNDPWIDTFGFVDTVQITPNIGGLLIFPSNIIHSVFPNNSETDRVSIAMNISLFAT